MYSSVPSVLGENMNVCSLVLVLLDGGIIVDNSRGPVSHFSGEFLTPYSLDEGASHFFHLFTVELCLLRIEEKGHRTRRGVDAPTQKLIPDLSGP